MILIGKFPQENRTSPIVGFSTTPLASIAGFWKFKIVDLIKPGGGGFVKYVFYA